MEKIKLSQDEYDDVVKRYREQKGYDDMSDEEKAEFDEKLDKVIECSDDEDETDRNEGSDSGKEKSDFDQYRDEMKERYGYDEMSDEEKQAFDEKLDELERGESGDTTDDDDNPHEIGARVLRRR